MALLLDQDRSPDTATEDSSPPVRSERTRPASRWWLPRVWAVCLWTLVAGGVVLGALALTRPTTPAQLNALRPATPTRWDVAGVAELFVAAFVAAGEGTEDNLRPFIGETPPALQGVTPGEWFASRVTTMSVEPLADRRWAVTVAVDLLRHDDEPGASFVGVGVRYFRLELVEENGSLAAAGLPAIVAGPPPVDAVDDDWPTGTPPVADDPLADTVARFLAALLTGDGELGRYAAPGSALRAAPATFETVTVERVAVRGRGERRRVRAWMTGESGSASMRLLYDLQLTRRDGRWEVNAVGTPIARDPAAPVAAADPSSIIDGS